MDFSWSAGVTMQEKPSQRPPAGGTAEAAGPLCSEDMAIDLAQWRVFLAVAERGSLSKAAGDLHTDQPALSRSLRRLERLVGAPLFERSNRGLTLTELGRRLRDPVRGLVEQADALEARAHAEARQAGGVLKVGAIDIYPITAAIAD